MPSVLTDQRVDSNSGPKVTLLNPAGATNEKLWDIVLTATTLTIRTVSDAGVAGTDALVLTRSGTTITGVAMSIDSIQAADDDTAAAALDPAVPVGGIYRTASALKIRVT